MGTSYFSVTQHVAMSSATHFKYTIPKLGDFSDSFRWSFWWKIKCSCWTFSHSWPNICKNYRLSCDRIRWTFIRPNSWSNRNVHSDWIRDKQVQNHHDRWSNWPDRRTCSLSSIHTSLGCYGWAPDVWSKILQSEHRRCLRGWGMGETVSPSFKWIEKNGWWNVWASTMTTKAAAAYENAKKCSALTSRLHAIALWLAFR